MTARWMIDGQRRQREPEIDLALDELAIDRRMAEQPIVRELEMQEFYLAGGWIPTEPAPLDP